MDGFSALRACVAQLSEVVDAVERISDTCVMTPEEAASLSQRLGCALAAVVTAGSVAAEAIVDTATSTRSQRRSPEPTAWASLHANCGDRIQRPRSPRARGVGATSRRGGRVACRKRPITPQKA